MRTRQWDVVETAIEGYKSSQPDFDSATRTGHNHTGWALLELEHPPYPQLLERAMSTAQCLLFRLDVKKIAPRTTTRELFWIIQLLKEKFSNLAFIMDFLSYTAT